MKKFPKGVKIYPRGVKFYVRWCEIPRKLTLRLEVWPWDLTLGLTLGFDLELDRYFVGTLRDKLYTTDNILKCLKFSLVETTVVWYALVRPLMTNLSADFGHIILTEKFYLRSLTACFCGFQNEILYSWHSFNKKCSIKLLSRQKDGLEKCDQHSVSNINTPKRTVDFIFMRI